MNICIITPAPPRSLNGNRITARRWARILRGLGHRVQIKQRYQNQRCDMMIALHARRSAESVSLYSHRYPDRPILLALTGTDLYGDLRTNKQAWQSMRTATRLIVLQPLGRKALPKSLRDRVRVIAQSVHRPPGVCTPRKDVFEVCVMGHLRPVKDPFRTAMAARSLPRHSRIQVTHIGAALSDAMARQARRQMQWNPRYRWLGAMPRWKALRQLGRSRLMVLSSKTEGGANVVSEALALAVPIVSTRIAGSIGILGEDYPGYFAVGDTVALKNMLLKAENDTTFYALLKNRCRRLRRWADPQREQRAWAKLIVECKCKKDITSPAFV